MGENVHGRGRAARPGDSVYDAIIVGGGPAGSTCARWLQRHGMRVLVIDRATFPRVKLCAGWISEPIWDVLELLPREYPHGLWGWRRCHVAYRGHAFTVPVRGSFIRRYELDAFLLERSGAQVVAGHAVKRVERDGDAWVVDGTWRCTYLVGAAGTHCPVARVVASERPARPVGVRELEAPADARTVAACRQGEDGEPELLLHADLRGYSWNVPKTSWVNIGCGTLDAREVHEAWRLARAHFADHVPPQVTAALEHMSGHAYHLFDERRLAACERDNAFLVGDALGLAHPITAEGILPAVLSGRLCADAILVGAPGDYGHDLRQHPIFAGYGLIRRGLQRASGLRRLRLPRLPRLPRTTDTTSRLGACVVATAFARMFSGRPLPRPLRALGRWL